MTRIILLFTLLFFISCNSEPVKKKANYSPEQVSEKKALVKSVMDVHDEAMAWMDEIHTLKTSIQNRVNNDSTLSTENDVKKQPFINSINELEEANEAMMDWMRNYREPKDTVQFSKAIDYLNNEKEEISLVRVQMKVAIDNAKLLLQ